MILSDSLSLTWPSNLSPGLLLHQGLKEPGLLACKPKWSPGNDGWQSQQNGKPPYCDVHV